MNESIQSDSSDIQETVRDFLDEILDCVIAETSRIEQQRGLAQQIVDELIREAVNASDRQNSGAGDVDRWRARIYNLQTIGGQSSGKDELQNVFNNQHVATHLNRSRSVTLTCFKSNKVEPIAIKSSPINASLPAPTFTQDQPDSDRMHNSHFSQSEDSSNASEDINASNVTEDTREYPRYEQTKTVKTSLGIIKVYCNGEIEEAELDRIVSESKKILYTRKQNDAIAKKAKKESKKKDGFCSRVRKFFRRLCCCSVQEEEEDKEEAKENDEKEEKQN